MPTLTPDPSPNFGRGVTEARGRGEGRALELIKPFINQAAQKQKAAERESFVRKFSISGFIYRKAGLAFPRTALAGLIRALRRTGNRRPGNGWTDIARRSVDAGRFAADQNVRFAA